MIPFERVDQRPALHEGAAEDDRAHDIRVGPARAPDADRSAARGPAASQPRGRTSAMARHHEEQIEREYTHTYAIHRTHRDRIAACDGPERE
jgi:hypothetical protein